MLYNFNKFIFGNEIFTNYKITCESKVACAQKCNLNKSSSVISSSSKIKLGSLLGAKVEGRDTYKVLMQTTKGNIALTNSSSDNYEGHSFVANSINDFVNNPNIEYLDVPSSDSIFVKAIFLFIPVIGLAIIFLVPANVFVVNLRKKEVKLIKHCFIKRHVKVLDFNEIKNIKLMQIKGGEQTEYKIILILQNNVLVPIGDVLKGGYFKQLKLAKKICEATGCKWNSEDILLKK